MKYVPRFTGRAVLSVALCVANYLAVAHAEVQSGQVSIKSVNGSATYTIAEKTLPLKADLVLSRGAVIKTASESSVDIILQYNGTVLRLMPESTLSFDKLNQETAGEETITE